MSTHQVLMREPKRREVAQAVAVDERFRLKTVSRPAFETGAGKAWAD